MSFPSKSKNGGVEQFRFSIAETEGQGSFECVQQTHNQLEVLGALPNKMRILANDDVYEQTKHRMAVAEETQKNKWYVVGQQHSIYNTKRFNVTSRVRASFAMLVVQH